MATIRTATVADLDAMRTFEREFVGHDVSRETFRERFERVPELFVLAEADGGRAGSGDGTLLGAASGYANGPEVDDDAAVLAAIGVRNGHEGNGLGRELLSAFEEGARVHADVVSVASADNVEGFYRACGYEPSLILVQVAGDELPADHASRVDLVDERSEDGTRFCYVGFDEYRPSVRVDARDRLGGFAANTIFRKRLDRD
ncbi:GNAT family N-acetyltransferase [Haloarchaeobius salinus]|uniref:GNAT family N-acetyltransferase n=1 Tax=Haloarchaeobius salinus TaxID=1198298 RepID=UPI002109F24D|nr:GNAT family N-acetyltransferase [Haloarchaeobius salinus]